MPKQSYCEIWKAACAEGKGGMEDGRPWMDPKIKATTVALGCDMEGTECVHHEKRSCDQPCRNCIESKSLREDFFWPQNEPLPEVG